MQIETRKCQFLSCIKRANRTEFGECKPVEVLFMREMVEQLQASLWP
jgi:hypothetical protein